MVPVCTQGQGGIVSIWIMVDFFLFCSNVKAYHAQIGEIKKDRGLIPAVLLA